MTRHHKQPGTGHTQSVWPVLLLVFVAVLAPTACMLWFMTQAVRNERLAVRQRLADVYREKLQTAQAKIDAYWAERELALVEVASTAAPGEAFAKLVTAGLAETVIFYDAHGNLQYPNPAHVREDTLAEDSPEWTEARRLEYESGRPAEAAAVLARIAAAATDNEFAARALLAQARCLAKAGQTAEALRVLTERLAEPRYHDAADAQGRLIRCSAKLLALDVLKDRTLPAYRDVADALAREAADYGDLTLPAGQRRFLMGELQAIYPDRPRFRTFAAEEAAAEYLECKCPMPQEVSCLKYPQPCADFVCLRAPGGSILAVYHWSTFASLMQGLLDTAVSLPGTTVQCEPRPWRHSEPFLAVPAGRYLPDFRLALRLATPDPFAAAAHRQVVLYSWTAGLGILLISGLALLVARFVTRQMKLTRLKNDLVATVSHELKTPLASMRVLIDTLREGRCSDPARVREYYGLIAKENERLSRLIDHFLAFSRMERNKQQFELAELNPAEVVTAAVDAMRDRLTSADCRLEVDIAPDLPRIDGDRDALVTVILNLLDNAYKYSSGERRIDVRAYAVDGHVCVAVRDNGIGLSRRAVKKVFDRFYQVDRSLSRSAGGCGLGLSIVQFIVTAHGGTVGVASELGRGSTFTVMLPAVPGSKRAEP